MFSYFSRSIVRKINAIILSLISIGLICFAVVIATTNYRAIILDLQEEASNTLELAKISLVEQIWTMNQVGLDDIRNAIMLDRDVVAIKVRDETAEVLTEGIRERYQDWTFDQLRENKQLQYQEVKVVKDNEAIGDVQILLSNEKALASVRWTSLLIAGFTFTLIIILGGVISFFGMRFLKGPVHSLQKSAVELAGGNLDEKIDTSRADEFGVLARSFSDMRDSIRLKISDLQRLNQTSEILANVFKAEKAFDVVLEIISQKVKSDWAVLYLNNEEDVVELKAQYAGNIGEAKDLPNQIKSGDGFWGKMAQGQSVFFSNSIKQELLNIEANAHDNNIQSLLSVPLIEDRKTIGMLVFAGVVNDLNYEEMDKEFVETVSRIATATLSRIKMMDVIAEHNHTLEQKVLERTAAIRDLMDNTGQGFLSFGMDYKINAEYSKACQTFFGRSIRNLDALETIFKECEPGKIKSIRELFDMVFNKETGLEMVIEMVPQELNIGKRCLSLDYKLINPVDQESALRMMVILTDITKEKNLAEQIKTEEERNTIIVKIALDKDGFIEFLQELEALFKSVYQQLEYGSLEEIETNALFRSLHTIKGGCASYGFKTIARAVHEIESVLEDIRSGTSKITADHVRHLQNQTRELEKMLRSSLDDLNEILPPEERQATIRYYRIAEEKILHLEEFMIKTIGNGHIKQIRDEIEYLCRQPLVSVFRKYAHSAEELSSQFNKMIHVDLVGTQLEVSYRRFESLFSTLVHLIRNSIDHGLETPDIRNMLGKPEIGSLTIEARRLDGKLILRISDDGAGIDPDKIKQIAVKKGLIDQETADNIKEDDIIDLIFAPGFSTHEQVTNISGRGVGMDAVKNAVEELDGNINIMTQIDQGTTFELSFPE